MFNCAVCGRLIIWFHPSSDLLTTTTSRDRLFSPLVANQSVVHLWRRSILCNFPLPTIFSNPFLLDEKAGGCAWFSSDALDIWRLRLRQWRAEAAECPGPRRFLDALENIFYSSRKISDNLFYLVIKMCHFFASVVKFFQNALLGCPQLLHHASVTTFFSSFLVIYLHFLRKLTPWMPPGWMPGSVAQAFSFKNTRRA